MYGKYKGVRESFGYGKRNKNDDIILDFSTSYDLIIINTYFKKKDQHLITYRSGHNCNQIDFFLARKVDKIIYKNCKVILDESSTNQTYADGIEYLLKNMKE